MAEMDCNVIYSATLTGGGSAEVETAWQLAHDATESFQIEEDKIEGLIVISVPT